MGKSAAKLRPGLRWCIAAVLGVNAIVGQAAQPASAGAEAPLVSGWVPWWSVSDSLASFSGNASQFSEVSPFWYTATTASTITRSGPLPANTVSLLLSSAHAAGVKVIPTITDGTPSLSTGSPNAMAELLAQPAQQALHVRTITNWVVANGFDGVDLDYESFAFRDGRASWAATSVNWIAMLTQLSQALHAKAKVLEVSVPPVYDAGRTTTSGYWVYDYAGMSTVVDRIKIMAYDFSSASASAGPIAPLVWDRKILGAALKLVPSSKLVLGIPAYGRDWVTAVQGSCPVGVVPATNSVTSEAAAALAYANGTVPRWDRTKGERTFLYTESHSGTDNAGNAVTCNVSRTVWFMDARGINLRVALARSKGVAGISLWSLGSEEPSAWSGISAASRGSKWKAPTYPIPPAPACLPPPVFSPPAQNAAQPQRQTPPKATRSSLRPPGCRVVPHPTQGN